jgi:hypothetical protein
MEFGISWQASQDNKLIEELVNTIDLAMDFGGLTVVVLSGWATAFLEEFIGRDPDSWDPFAHDFPVVSKEYSPSIVTSTLMSIKE